MRPRVLLADDHAVVADGLARLITDVADLVGQVNDGVRLVEETHRLRPDIVVADVTMPGMSGIDAMRRLKAEGSEARFIFLTIHTEARLAAEAMRSGAAAYLLKQSAGNELLDAIQAVMHGRTYLTPLVASSFHNSLQFQKRVFEWTPSERTMVLMNDLADYGNASAGSAPRNGIIVYVAPPSRTLETMPSSERMYSLMNHETVHVANADVANSRDQRWRRFFGGKPAPNQEHPESILYNYLTVPRYNAPRWYFEGAATFMETWMAGGIGRAQGAFDEMVFRAMVRDNAHFYSNLGLVSKGVATDFQTVTNAYLYGTRFDTYLAFVHSPEAVVEWLKRDEGSEAYYARPGHTPEIHAGTEIVEFSPAEDLARTIEVVTRNLEGAQA